MSSRGVFSALQELYPQEPGRASAGPDELFLWQVYARALAEFDSVGQVTELLETRRVIQHERGKNLHVIVADPDGGALVVEPGDEGNALTPIDGRFIVMTNFCIYDFAGSEPDDIIGFGADRYVAARSYLDEHADSLDLEGAFEVLKRTAWEWTQASMVFAPERGEVYLAFRGDFEKVLRVTLATRTVETYSGYDQQASWSIGALGLPATTFDRPRSGFLARLKQLLRI
jgi:hypothetical protein